MRLRPAATSARDTDVRRSAVGAACRASRKSGFTAAESVSSILAAAAVFQPGITQCGVRTH